MPEFDDWSISHLKEHLEALVETNRKLADQRYANDQKSLEVALQTNNKRLDNMNEFREALIDQTTRLMTRTEYEASHRGLSDKLETGLATVNNKLVESINVLDAKTDNAIAPIESKIAQIGRPNWTLITSFLSIAGISIAGLWLVIGLQITNSNQPLSLQIEAIRTASGLSDKQLLDIRASRDRQLNDLQVIVTHNVQQVEATGQAIGNLEAIQSSRTRLADTISGQVATLQADQREGSATTREKLAEIETQLKTISTVINLYKDDSGQQLGVLWKKVFNVDLPPKTFRPELYTR